MHHSEGCKTSGWWCEWANQQQEVQSDNARNYAGPLAACCNSINSTKWFLCKHTLSCSGSQWIWSLPVKRHEYSTVRCSAPSTHSLTPRADLAELNYTCACWVGKPHTDMTGVKQNTTESPELRIEPGSIEVVRYLLHHGADTHICTVKMYIIQET